MAPKKEQAPKVDGPKGWINRAYLYGERHVATVALVALGLGVVLSAAAFYSFFHERDIESRVTREITRVESKCQRYGPRSQQCHESFGAALKSLNETLTPVEARIIVCRSHLFDDLPACRKVRRVEAAESEPEKTPGPVASSEGVMPSTPNKGHSPSGPSPGGPTDSPSHPHAPSVPDQSSGGGGDEVTAPAAAPSSPPVIPERITEVVHEAGPPSGPPVETAAALVREAVGGVLGGVGSTVEEAGGTVNEVVGGVACGLTGALEVPCK